MATLHQDIESFLPSEIARLVYGYLEEEECTRAARTFLETSTHLKECFAVAKKGRKFSTKMYGLSLLDLFDLLSESICFLKENIKNVKETNNLSSRLIGLLQSDSENFELKENTTENENVTSICIDFVNHQVRNVNQPLSINNAGSIEIPNNVNHSRSKQIKERSGFYPTQLVKIKEEIDARESSIDLEDDEDTVSMMEPEVQILSSADDNFKQEPFPEIGVVSDPLALNQPTQIICQPYGMVQMVPAYPGSQNLSTTLYMPQQSITAPSTQPITVKHSQALTINSEARSSFITSGLKTYKRASNYPGDGSKSSKVCKLNPNIYQSSSKLRPIAPKITQSLENGVKIEVINTKNCHPKPSPAITKRSLRSRNNSRKSVQTKTPQCIDIQEMVNNN